MSNSPLASTVIEGELVDEGTEVVNVLARIGASDMDASLAVQLSQAEIDQQIATARKWPRSIDKAVKAITELATYDPETAQECTYNLPRGRGADAKVISGPSIRMAELIAQQWGNNRSDARVVHVDRKEKYIEAEGVYHDLETNVAVRAKVRRRISDSKGRIYNDDMIIVTGNAACSIALRNAILRGVPKPIWRAAYEKALAVVRGDERTLQTRRQQLIGAFEVLGVLPEQVYDLAGVTGFRDIGLDQLVYLAGIYTAIKNNEVTAEDLLQERKAATPQQSPKGLQSGFGDEATGKAAPKAAGKAKATETPHDPATGEVRETETPETDSAAAETERTEPETEKGQVDNADAPAAEQVDALTVEASTPDDDEDETTAPAGEQYLLIGEGYGEDKRRATYQDGKPFSRVTEKGAAKLTAYDRHAPELPAEDAPATDERVDDDKGAPVSHGVHEFPPVETEAAADAADDAASAQVDDASGGNPGNPFEAFEDQLQDAGSWAFITQALRALSTSPAWPTADEEAKRLARIAAYERYEELVNANEQEPVGLTADLQLFRCWLETPTLTGPEIQKVWRDVIRSTAYGGLDEASKDSLGGAVAARKDSAG